MKLLANSGIGLAYLSLRRVVLKKILLISLLITIHCTWAQDEVNTDCIGDFELKRNQDERCLKNMKLVMIDYFSRYKAVVNQYEMDKLDANAELENFQHPNIHEIFYQPVYGISFDNIHDNGAYAAGTIHKRAIRFIKDYRNKDGASVDERKDILCYDDRIIYHHDKYTKPYWIFSETTSIEIECEYKRINQ